MLKMEDIMKHYVCSLCGYIYKPEENDNIEFEDLDVNWICPVCGASKEEFEEIV